VKSPRKRQKRFGFLDIGEQVGPLAKHQENVKEPIKETVQEIVEETGQDTLEDNQERIKDEVFRFMDLPGGEYHETSRQYVLTFLELRNRIYEYAAEYAHRCFPPIFPKQKKKRKGTPYWPLAALDKTIKDDLKVIPFLGLTQSCALIRTEFRPMWLSTNRVPFCALTNYLKVFYPPTPTDPEARKRFKSFQGQPAGNLRIWVRKTELEDTDILRLLKHRQRFPGLNLQFTAQDTIPNGKLSPLSLLIDNDNPKWTKWIKGSIITQVRLMWSASVRIVIKERYAPDWMKVTLYPNRRIDEKFVESFGLADLAKAWSISWGVGY
jgi:hypothetical protein